MRIGTVKDWAAGWPLCFHYCHRRVPALRAEQSLALHHLRLRYSSRRVTYCDIKHMFITRPFSRLSRHALCGWLASRRRRWMNVESSSTPTSKANVHHAKGAEPRSPLLLTHCHFPLLHRQSNFITDSLWMPSQPSIGSPVIFTVTQTVALRFDVPRTDEQVASTS